MLAVVIETCKKITPTARSVKEESKEITVNEDYAN